MPLLRSLVRGAAPRPNCGDTDLRDLGYGTEKIEAAVRAILPKARTARMDLDTTRSRSSYDQIIGQFQRGQTDILIGTQMVTKGLDFDRVRVVGIINADQSLSRADFRATSARSRCSRRWPGVPDAASAAAWWCCKHASPSCPSSGKSY